MEGFFQLLFYASEIIGTVAFAASGAMLAIDREMDLFGVLFEGIIAAVGGGVMRDVLLGTFPPNAFSNSVYVAVAFATSLVVFLYAYLRGSNYWRQLATMDRIINLLDAIGLGIFTVVGIQTAMDKGFSDNLFLCLFMGMTTGVGGGILRDLLSLTVPAVLVKRIYAVASLIGGGCFILILHLTANGPIAMLAGMLVTIVIRMVSTHFAWDLPKVHRN